jgi:hypothetical protein
VALVFFRHWPCRPSQHLFLQTPLGISSGSVRRHLSGEGADPQLYIEFQAHKQLLVNYRVLYGLT